MQSVGFCLFYYISDNVHAARRAAGLLLILHTCFIKSSCNYLSLPANKNINGKGNHDTHNHEAHDPGVANLEGHVNGLHAPIDLEIEPFLKLNRLGWP